MKKNGKMILGVVSIYVVVSVLTLLLSNRVEMLEKREDLRNLNASVAYNLK